MDGIFIPIEFQDLEDLTNTESMVLAIYKYYTEKGSLHCCSLRNEDICKMVRLKDESGLRKIKKHLKELGYIRTDGGIRVYYLGIGGEYNHSREGIYSPQGGNIIPQGGEYNPKKEGIYSPQNKKEKRKKEIKKEEKGMMTNFDLLLGRLPEDYKTPETIEYIKNNYLDRINSIDFSDGGVIDSWITGLKKELLKKFTIYPVINQPVLPEVKKEDDFMY